MVYLLLRPMPLVISLLATYTSAFSILQGRKIVRSLSFGPYGVPLLQMAASAESGASGGNGLFGELDGISRSNSYSTGSVVSVMNFLCFVMKS
jgi:hypothetical protein